MKPGVKAAPKYDVDGRDRKMKIIWHRLHMNLSIIFEFYLSFSGIIDVT